MLWQSFVVRVLETNQHLLVLQNVGRDAIMCGNNYSRSHIALGFAIAKSGMAFVYGGGNKGIMGVVSGAALQAGAHVTG